MNERKIIHLGTTDFAGKGPGTYTGGTVKLAKDYSRDVYSSAVQFLKTAELCLNDGKIEEGKTIHLIPGVVCAAFACELALKWLIYMSIGVEQKGHDLNILFGELEANDRKAIEAKVADIDGFLQRNKNLFIEARYHHEVPEFAFREQEILQFAKELMTHMQSKQ